MAEKIIFVEGDLTTGDGKIYGEFLNPIKMALLHESDINEKKNGALSYLFNMEKSRNSSEAIVGQEGFNVYSPKNEGDEAEYDTFKNTDSKVIRHLTYAKTFKISMEAAEDAKFGLTTTMRSGATELVRSYYSTRNYLAEMALAKATDASFSMGSGTNAKTLDLTTGDGKALFANDHGTNSNKCNYFKVGAEGLQATEDIEEILGELSDKISCFEDAHGNITGYTADTIIVPRCRGKLVRALKKIAGTENALGSGDNDINIQYGNWNIVVLPRWNTTCDEFMVMSSAANRALAGNMFFQRSPLSIKRYVETETRNLTYNGIARMGIGFGTWKHIARVIASPDVETANTL